MGHADSSAPARPDYEAGALIADKYRLTRLIGEGAMGAVWAARNEVLDSNVAIKLLHREQEAETASPKLLKEARAASRLGHPAIVRIFDFGHTQQGDPFLVMERLEGESLADRLDRRSRIDGVQAAQTLLPILGALAMAHEMGIVHRDVKPENIFLAQTDGRRIQPKLLDFGVAKLTGPAPEGSGTLEGALVGSAPYMSPEQARGLGDIDHRADLWAAAVVLYELVTGQRPFEGANYNAVMMAIVSEEPRPITALAAGDAELWAIIGKGLAKDRADRWESARDFGMALAHWLIDRDCADDLSGASIQATWFAPTTVSSSPPPGEEGRPTASVPPPRSDRFSAAAGRSERSWDQITSAHPAAPDEKPGRKGVLIAGGAVVALGVGALVWVRFGATDAEPLPVPSATSPRTATPAAASQPVVASPPPTESVAPAPPASAGVESAPSAAPSTSARSAPSGATPPAAATFAPRKVVRPRSAPVPVAPPPAPARKPTGTLKDPY